jgi:AcrR family transcriptional regulator
MTDEQILTIAAHLWLQSDGADFTMERLVEATGISRATLYRRFGSREAILQRLVDEQAIDAPELARPDIRTRIVQATRVVLSRYGFAGTTVEQIAQEAGVGPATVYRHFGSKEALIEAFVQASHPRQLLRSFTANAESDLEADLTLLATTMLEFVHENPWLIRMLVFESQEAKALLAQVRATQGRTVTYLAKYLADHMALGHLPEADPFDLALAFFGMLLGFGFVGPHSYDRPVTDTKSTAQLATRIFLHGVAQVQPQKLESHHERINASSHPTL